MKKMVPYITNKYLITTLFLFVWVLFFDENDYITTQKSRLNDLATLSKKRAYYKREIETAQQELSDIQNSDDALEKFARERYLMKKNGEDIFIIETPTP
ncbi:MAG: FtsB family cell division protein [Chitinophagaceae bacterium]